MIRKKVYEQDVFGIPPPRLSPFYAALSGHMGCVGFICNPGRCPGLFVSKAFSLFELQVRYIFRLVTGGDYTNITFDIPDKLSRRPAGAIYIKPNASRWVQHGHHHPALKGQHTPGLRFFNAIRDHLNEF